MHPLAKLDHQYLWHPFTQMRDWLKREPIVLVEGEGALLRDVHGREYLDANSSIWTNLHGHNHPKINVAINRQLKKVAHTSALGFANEPASLLGEKLVNLANVQGKAWRPRTAEVGRVCPHTAEAHLGSDSIPRRAEDSPALPGGRGVGHVFPHTAEASGSSRSNWFSKVFFSDNGSTALEVSLKLAYQSARRRGVSNPRFICLEGAYHGDTVGAVSLGHIGLFHGAYSGLLFKSASIPAPYCYRCKFNRTVPERADARTYCKCDRECVTRVEETFQRQQRKGNPFTAFVFEPRMQGAAGMIAQPDGWLARTTDIARGFGAQLIADEVMTGFGRTGPGPAGADWLFACQHEGVRPDFLNIAKGLTGGYLPMAATITTQPVFDSFLGEYEEFKTFFHGHSYTGNQLGAAAALASLGLLATPESLRRRRGLEGSLRSELQTLWTNPHVGDIRQVGLVAGVELVRDWRTREPFELRERVGIKICDAMARMGVLTRPVGNVIVLMPPYCTTSKQMKAMVTALRCAVDKVFQNR